VPAAYPPRASLSVGGGHTLMFLRLLLRLDPWLPSGQICLAPAAARLAGPVAGGGRALGDQRLDVAVAGSEVSVTASPASPCCPAPPPLTGLAGAATER